MDWIATPKDYNDVDEEYHRMIEFMKPLLEYYCQNQYPLPGITEADVSKYMNTLNKNKVHFHTLNLHHQRSFFSVTKLLNDIFYKLQVPDVFIKLVY